MVNSTVRSLYRADNRCTIQARRLILALALGFTGLSHNAFAQTNPDLSTDLAIDQNQFIQNSVSQAVTQEYIDRLPKGFVESNSALLENLRPLFTPPTLASGHGYLAFVLDPSLTYNSNPGNAHANPRASFESDPKLQLNTAYQFTFGQLSLASTADTDRYFSASAADADGWNSTLKFAFNQPPANQLTNNGLPKVSVVPYLEYLPSLRFKSNFGTRTGAINDLGGGVSIKPVLAAPWSFELAVEGTRRYSDVSSDSTSLYAKPALSYAFNKDTKAIIAPNLRERWYDENRGSTRRDLTLIIPAQIAWTPDFLSCFKGQIIFSLNFQRNYSTISSDTSHQWNIGPTIELVHYFWGDKS